MHNAIVVSDEVSLEELNHVLGEGGWWVKQISPSNDGSWLVILTDRDPDSVAPNQRRAYEEADADNEN